MKMVVLDWYNHVTSYGHAMWPRPIEMRETNKVGHVKLFTNEIEALTHEMNTFGFVTTIFVVKSELIQIESPYFWKFMVCLCAPSTLMY